MGSLSEEHAHSIRAAIRVAREAGVNVLLDWDEGEDGMHIKLTTSIHRRDSDGIMRIVDGPFIVEGY